ncbi:MAG: site-2 protease family protein [Pseudomonadota bacterium]
MRTGIRLGTIGGVEIVVDWSLLIIFALIALSLGAGVLPQWHPQWSAGLVWGTALVAALMFFASVLAHELSHAFVGRGAGIRIPRITLFVFGGMAQMEREPPSWGSELRMAIVGPLTSLAIGLACLWLAGVLAGPVPADGADAAADYLAGLSPTATVLIWLGSINLLLGFFNLVPGFPLDGGRVLRAIAWGITGNHGRATQMASLIGQGVAWLLMGIGVAMLLGVRVPVFGYGLGGLWLILIGWFLNGAALLSYRQVQLREALEDVPVSGLMQTRFTHLEPDLRVSELIDRHVVPGGERAFAVECDGRFVGLVCIRDLQRSVREQWHETTVAQIMTPLERLQTVAPQQRASEALDLLTQRGVNQLPVIDHGRLVGLIDRESLLRWLAYRGRPGQGARSVEGLKA